MEEIEERYGDSPGSRLRSLLFVTQRSDKRPCGAAAASQRNPQGPPARRRDRRLARGRFPFRTESLVKNPLSFERTYFFAATYPFRSDISLDQLR